MQVAGIYLVADNRVVTLKEECTAQKYATVRFNTFFHLKINLWIAILTKTVIKFRDIDIWGRVERCIPPLPPFGGNFLIKIPNKGRRNGPKWPTPRPGDKNLSPPPKETPICVPDLKRS